MDQKKIGKFLQELRKEKGLTQEQVAKRFNTTNRTISRWETGSNTPDISMLVEIAEFYGVDVREIIDGERKTDTMEREVKEVAVKMADYAGQEKDKILRFVRRISSASVILSGLILAHYLYGMVFSASFNIIGVLFLLMLFVFSSITALYTNGKLETINRKTVANIALKSFLILFICITSLGCLSMLFVIGIFGMFSLNPFNYKKAEGIEKYDKQAIMEKYGGDMCTALYVFPDSTDKMIDAEYDSYFFYGLLDTDCYIVLKATYSDEDLEAECSRLADIDCTVEYNGESYYQEIRYDEDSYNYPAYVAVDGYSHEYEYALIDEADNEIIYIYFSYPDTTLKHIDEDYRKIDEGAYTIEGSTLDQFNIYYHYDPNEGLAVSDV